MRKLFRGRAGTPPPPGVTVEPLDPEGLSAIVRDLSEATDGPVGFCGAAAYKGNGWTIYESGVVEDPGQDSRCVSMKTALLSRVRLDLAQRASSTAEAHHAWERVRDGNVPAVNLLALAVGIASDPGGVDRMAGR